MKTKIERIWSISLIVIGIATFILAGSSVIGIELPDIAVRIIGVIDLIALLVLIYTSVMKGKDNHTLNEKDTVNSFAQIHF